MNTQRVPRPKGTTEIAEAYYNCPPQKTNEEDNITSLNKNPIEQHIIRHYINTGYQYCNHPMDLITFMNYTNIPEKDIHEYLIERNNTIGYIGDKEQQEGMMMAILMGILGGALNDRQTALYHQQVLLQSQGGEYKPFISGEVTKALKLSQESNAQVLNVLKSLMPNKGPNVLNQFNQQNNFLSDSGANSEMAKGLTVDEAMSIIYQSAGYAPLLSDESQKEALALEHLDKDCPEVRAIHQSGLDTEREGLNFSNIVQISDSLLEPEEVKHLDRRAIELGVDLEDDDNI